MYCVYAVMQNLLVHEVGMVYTYLAYYHLLLITELLY